MEVQFSQNQFPTHDTNRGGPVPQFVAKVGPEFGSINELPGMDSFGRVGTGNKRRVREAARLYADALEGRIDPFLLKQAMHPTSQVFVDHLAQKYPGIYSDRGL